MACQQAAGMDCEYPLDFFPLWHSFKSRIIITKKQGTSAPKTPFVIVFISVTAYYALSLPEYHMPMHTRGDSCEITCDSILSEQ